MLKKILLVIIIASLQSCIDSISLDNDANVRVLVVEGGITTEYGPHSIHLSNSAKYGDVFSGVIRPEKGAELLIRDEEGNIVQLSDKGNGLYQTPDDFKGEVGKKYSLLIVRSNGAQYMSYPEPIVEVPKIDSVYFEFDEVSRKLENGEELVPGVNIFAKYNNPSGEFNYFKWESTGTYRIKTNPELYTPPLSQNPVPKDCCEICYINERNTELSLSSDRLYDGNPNDQQVLFIEDDGARFSDKYVLILEQLSLSKDAFNFFDILKSQLSIDGDIFDPPAAQLRGNILNISNPDEDVVGYFTASDVVSDTLHIRGLDLPVVQNPPFIPDDCRVLSNSTVDQPPFWQY